MVCPHFVDKQNDSIYAPQPLSLNYLEVSEILFRQNIKATFLGKKWVVEELLLHSTCQQAKGDTESEPGGQDSFSLSIKWDNPVILTSGALRED